MLEIKRINGKVLYHYEHTEKQPSDDIPVLFPNYDKYKYIKWQQDNQEMIEHIINEYIDSVYKLHPNIYLNVMNFEKQITYWLYNGYNRFN